MAGMMGSWLSGPPPAEAGEYPGQRLGLPRSGPGSLVGFGRRLLALALDWLAAVGLAGLAVTFGRVRLEEYFLSGTWQNTATVIWVLLGVVAVRMYGFTPGQFGCGLRVVSVDYRLHVGIGRAALRVLLIALVIPALFTDQDGRGLQDRATGTAVVRR